MTETLGSGSSLVLYTDGSSNAAASRSTPASPARRRDPRRPGRATALCDHVFSRLLPAADQLHDDVTAVLARIG